MKYVFNDSASKDSAEFPLGVLTAENRDTWASVREHLVKTHNENALNTIDTAIFCLAIDDKADYSPENPVPIVQNMLHGDKNGLINRWFDKSLTLIVCKDGNAGINFEHSWGDGVAVLRYFNEIYKETTTKPICQPSDIQNASSDDTEENIFKIGETFKILLIDKYIKNAIIHFHIIFSVEFNLDDISKAAIKKAQGIHSTQEP